MEYIIILNSMSYNFFTAYYDEVVRGQWYSLEDEVSLICEFLGEFWNEGKDILEFACGTGTVAKALQKKWFSLYGIDLNTVMLEKAVKNMWADNCEKGDMTTYESWKKYDYVLCNYNSICHLTDFELWKKCFDSASNNLKKWGLFIFDINTVQEFENICRDFAQFYNIWDDTVCLEMEKRWDIYEWIVKMFIKNDDGTYKMELEKIPEISFSIEKIESELKAKWFKILHLEDFHKWKVDKESERVYFVAQKI